MKRILIALGGNALGDDYLEQQKLLENASKELVGLFKDNEVVIAHGNGPQVGMITKAFSNNNVDMPLDCCTAMSEGYIGFHIQRKFRKTLQSKKINRDIVTLVTEVVVDKNDPSFKNPSKPIGKFYSKKEAKTLMKKTGDTYVEDAGRGYRKVVASPKPKDIINVPVMDKLLKAGTIVVSVGGGGIPVFKDYNNKKVEAVIDKDLASALLAEKLKCDEFIILTAVNQVKINFGKPNEKSLDTLTIADAKKYMKQDEFKKGSMLPKIEAAISFVEKTGRDAIITSLDNVKGILNRKNITIIKRN